MLELERRVQRAFPAWLDLPCPLRGDSQIALRQRQPGTIRHPMREGLFEIVLLHDRDSASHPFARLLWLAESLMYARQGHTGYDHRSLDRPCFKLCERFGQLRACRDQLIALIEHAAEAQAGVRGEWHPMPKWLCCALQIVLIEPFRLAQTTGDFERQA